MTTDDDLTTISTILKSARFATVTTRGAHRELHSRPLAILETDFTGTLWFFTQDPSPKTAEIAKHPEVNVAAGHQKGYLSLSGTASIDRDPATIDKYWNPYAEAWFELGRDDPSVALLRVDVNTAEIWDTYQPPPDVGENTTVAID
jgi:general stress protein 26